MFSKSQYSISLLLMSVLVMTGCSAEGDVRNAESQARVSGSQTNHSLQIDALKSQPLEQVWHQEEFRFHGVVRGINSYNETIFEQGKIISLNTKEGQLVQKGDVIAELYSPILAEKFEQAKANVKRSEAQLKLDQESLARSQTLYEKNLISQQALDEAKRDYDTSKQAMKEAESLAAQAKNEFSDTQIKAKEGGVVAKIFKREGDFINPGEAVFRFESIAKQKVSFSLPEKLAVNIKQGDQHSIHVPANGEELMGTVIEKSLPTSDGLRLHTITFEINSLRPEFMGLRVILRYTTPKELAFKVDYRAIRYSEHNQPYLIKAGQPLQSIPVSILDMKNQSILVSADAQNNTPVLVGNEVSLPVNLHTF